MRPPGLIEPYIHGGGRIGAIVEINCETDFVARTPDFRSWPTTGHAGRRDLASVRVGRGDPGRCLGCARAASTAAATKALRSRRSCSTSRSSRTPKLTIRDLVQGRDRQARREHRRAPLRPIRSRSRHTPPAAGRGQTSGPIRRRACRPGQLRPAANSGGVVAERAVRASPPQAQRRSHGRRVCLGIDPRSSTVWPSKSSESPITACQIGDRHRRRQHLARTVGKQQGHGPRHRRLHGHGRHRAQRAGLQDALEKQTSRPG